MIVWILEERVWLHCGVGQTSYSEMSCDLIGIFSSKKRAISCIDRDLFANAGSYAALYGTEIDGLMSPTPLDKPLANVIDLSFFDQHGNQLKDQPIPYDV